MLLSFFWGYTQGMYSMVFDQSWGIIFCLLFIILSFFLYAITFATTISFNKYKMTNTVSSQPLLTHKLVRQEQHFVRIPPTVLFASLNLVWFVQSSNFSLFFPFSRFWEASPIFRHLAWVFNPLSLVSTALFQLSNS